MSKETGEIRSLLKLTPQTFYILFNRGYVKKMNELISNEPNIKIDGVASRYGTEVYVLKISSYYDLKDLQFKKLRRGFRPRYNPCLTEWYRTDNFLSVDRFSSICGCKLAEPGRPLETIFV